MIQSEPQDSAEAIDRVLEALIDLDADRLVALLGADPETGAEGRIDALLVPAMEQMGAAWERGDVALSQMYLAGKLCEEILVRAIPEEGARPVDQGPRLGLAILEDYHLLGKRMVKSVLRASGHPVLDYGRMTVDSLLAALRKNEVDLLFVSTLMLPSALRVKALCSGIAQEGLPVKVIVGGAPFRYDKNLWKEVGADGMGENASSALAFVREMAGGVA